MVSLVHIGALTLCILAVQAADASSLICSFPLEEDEELTTLNDDFCGERQEGLFLLQRGAQKGKTATRLAKAAPAFNTRVPTAAAAAAVANSSYITPTNTRVPTAAAAAPVVNSSFATGIAPGRKVDIRPFVLGNQRLSMLLLEDKLTQASSAITSQRWLTYMGTTTYLMICLVGAILAYVCMIVCILNISTKNAEKAGEEHKSKPLSKLPAGQVLLGSCAQDSYSRPAGSFAVQKQSPCQSEGATHGALTEQSKSPTAFPPASLAQPAKASPAHAATLEETVPAPDVPAERPRSALCPNIVLLSTRRLLISAVASDSRMRGPFDVYWSEDGLADGPRFRLYVRDAAGHADMLELCEVKPGSKSTGWLFGTSSGSLPPCARIGPVRPKLSNYLVSNMQANMKTSGLSYRKAKDLNAKIAGGIVPWNSVVVGVEEGDGWLKVGDYFLPMLVNGVLVVFSMDSMASSRLLITDAEDKVCAVLEPQGVGPTVGQFRVEQGGQVAMVLSTGGASSRLEMRSAQGAHLAAVSHQKITAMGQELMELSLDESTDPMLVLLCSVAVLRRLVS
mmetsp:Transcript_129402/g.235200  ORF Transcript_129402/g.235200 Transcript_129402/m.235200 type:complete len:565 (-) Transcript_129402:129-1823(-)